MKCENCNYYDEKTWDDDGETKTENCGFCEVISDIVEWDDDSKDMECGVDEQ